MLSVVPAAVCLLMSVADAAAFSAASATRDSSSTCGLRWRAVRKGSTAVICECSSSAESC